MFSVIETVNEEGMKEVSVVCTKWIDGGQVAWPTNYRKAIKKQIDPSEDWQKYNCKILKQNMNFDEAKTKELYFSKFSSSECDESVYNPKKKFLIKNFNYQFDKSAATSTEHGNKENDSINLNSNINPIEILSIEKLPPITTSNYEQPNEVVNSKSDTVEIITHSEGDSFFLTDHNLCTPVFRANCFIETDNHINTDIVETGNENTNEETPAVSNIVFQSQNGNFQSEYSIQRPLENAEVSHINFKLEKTLKKVNDVKEKVKQNKIAIKGVQTDILTIRENQKKIIDNQADIMECLQLIIKGLPKQTQAPIILDQNFIVPHLPITTVENLTKLNSKLSNKHYMDQMVITKNFLSLVNKN